MKNWPSILLVASILAASTSTSYAGQNVIYRKPVGHFGGTHGFAAPMGGFHGPALRPSGGRFAYGHVARYRHWDGRRWVSDYGDPEYVDGGPTDAGAAAAAIFGLTAGFLQAAGAR